MKYIVNISVIIVMTLIIFSTVSFANIEKKHWAYDTLIEFKDKKFVDNNFNADSLNDFINKRWAC